MRYILQHPDTTPHLRASAYRAIDGLVSMENPETGLPVRGIAEAGGLQHMQDWQLPRQTLELLRLLGQGPYDFPDMREALSQAIDRLSRPAVTVTLAEGSWVQARRQIVDQAREYFAQYGLRWDRDWQYKMNWQKFDSLAQVPGALDSTSPDSRGIRRPRRAGIIRNGPFLMQGMREVVIE